MVSTGNSTEEASAFNAEDRYQFETEEVEPLRCWECNINFTGKEYLHDHLFHHIKQPEIKLHRVQLPPLKLTLNRHGNKFEIVGSPTGSTYKLSPSYLAAFNLAENNEEENSSGNEEVQNENSNNQYNENEAKENENEENYIQNKEQTESEEEACINFAANFGNGETDSTATEDDGTNRKTIEDVENSETSDYGSIPGTEPTPPPIESTEYPKIRIKTTGLLQEPLTITEISDDTSDTNTSCHRSDRDLWGNSAEDPLKLPDDANLMSLFNNNERAKDLGFTTSDSEFISLDRLEERSRNALQLYNPPSSVSQNSLNNLTGLPMEALAQQVSRLQPSGNGMHQQNVLINIQQFPQAPPPHPPPAYQPPPMYHHPHPSQSMYHQPYQYQPPNPIYYPPAPGYPQHMPPPPQPQMPMAQPMGQPQMGQPSMVQPQTSQPQSLSQALSSNQQYRQQPMPPRQSAPRQMPPNQRMPLPQPRQPSMNSRQPMARPRAPMVRPRAATGITAVRGGIRPRMPVPQNGQNMNNTNNKGPLSTGAKRSPEQVQGAQAAAAAAAVAAKRKRFDVLTPDKDDDDCQVICMQPNNKDGGLPQIQSVQGGTSEPSENSVMHLSDSITLSVRNPQPRPQSPKKSDAKAVANILATRGITVTATPKPKEKPEQKNTSLPQSLNLNGAVSIIPSSKNTAPTSNNSNNSINKNSSNGSESQLPTVDLTDETPTPPQQSSLNQPKPQVANGPQKIQTSSQRGNLPFRCDLCTAQYPNYVGLTKHRQNYHKATGAPNELGIPVVNLKHPGVFQKMTSLGIYNYIPLPSAGPDGTFALPIINSRSANAGALGTNTMLTLGPIKYILPNANKTSASKTPIHKGGEVVNK